MKKNKITLLLLLLLSILSCKKGFLDSPIRDSLIRQDYVIDLKTTQEYLNGVYVNLGNNYRYIHTIYPELVADNIKPLSIGSNVLLRHYNWSQYSDNLNQTTNNFNGFSFALYNNIRSANFVLEQASKFEFENIQKANNLRGQAFAIRAILYFHLINVFAQPYSFTTTANHQGVAYVKTSDITAATKRNSVAEVYESIISDLNNAIELLPDIQALPNGIVSKGLINRLAAKAILARVYLFKGDFENSARISKDVCNIAPLLTVNYPAKLFTGDDLEALFTVPPGRSVATGIDYSTSFAGIYFRTQKQYVATKDIADLLNSNAGDLRKAWVVFNAGNWDIVKFPMGVVPDISTPAGSYYHPVIRSSEMFLTAAESFAKLGKLDSARYFVNAVRTRANLEPIGSSVLAGPLMDSIYLERRKELAFEGLRMFDLQRLKLGVNRIDAPNPLAQTLPYPNGKAIAPIPGIDVSLLGYSQNPGY